MTERICFQLNELPPSAIHALIVYLEAEHPLDPRLFQLRITLNLLTGEGDNLEESEC